MITTLTLIIQIISSIVLVILIVLQSKSGGLGSVFGGTGSYSTRRGVEVVIFRLTILIAVIFFMASASRLFFR